MALWVEIRCEWDIAENCSGGHGELVNETVKDAAYALKLLRRVMTDGGWKKIDGGLVCNECQQHGKLNIVQNS